MSQRRSTMEAAKSRHPSDGAPGVILTAADRCDDACNAAALYRVSVTREGDALVLDWCRHHWMKYKPGMMDGGWQVVGINPDLVNLV